MKIDRSYEKFEHIVFAGKDCRPVSGDLGYAKDYEKITLWFSGQKTWTEDQVIIASLVVYGWMPTILRSNKMKDTKGFADRLNSRELRESDYCLINGSYVGTSKFLHFWSPNEFAIWDRRICATLEWGVLTNTEANFLCYQGHCRRFSKIHGWRLRDIEQSLFLQNNKIN